MVSCTFCDLYARFLTLWAKTACFTLCRRGAQWQTALTTLDTCHCSSLQTSSVTYGTLLKLCKESLHSLCMSVSAVCLFWMLDPSSVFWGECPLTMRRCFFYHAHFFVFWVHDRFALTGRTVESPFQFCQDSWLLALHSLQRMGWVNLESNVVISGSMIASCETVSLWLRAMELLQYPSIISCLALNVANPCAKTTQWYHYSIKDGDPC